MIAKKTTALPFAKADLAFPKDRGRRVGLCETGLELKGAAIAERRMPAPAVVEHLDILEQRTSRVIAIRIGLAMHQLPLERPEEARRHRVVPAEAGLIRESREAIAGQLAVALDRAAAGAATAWSFAVIAGKPDGTRSRP